MGLQHTLSRGYRAGTRDLFSKKFRTKGGNPCLTTYLRKYKVGDMVDVIANPAQQKGMPHKYYHGKTGRVWNITKRAIGVEINKVFRQKQMVKRIHVRVEHARPSRCQSGHFARVKANEIIKAAAKAKGEKPGAYSVSLKREAKGPRPAFKLDLQGTLGAKVHLLVPQAYVFKPMQQPYLIK